MPITSVYDLGTATVTQGSKQVTGTDVNWIGAGLREGDMFWCAGLTVRIEELVSNTEVTLAHDWPGSSGSDVPYEVHYTADTGRVLAKSTQLLNEFENNALNPLKALNPAQDTVPYFTGADTAALATLSQQGRSIIASNNLVHLRNLLELVKQDNKLDMTQTKLMLVGAFGLGDWQGPVMTDLNSTTTRTGFYRATNGVTLGVFPPLVATNNGVIHLKVLAGVANQIFFSSHASSPIYYRRATATDTWQDWREFNLT